MSRLICPQPLPPAIVTVIDIYFNAEVGVCYLCFVARNVWVFLLLAALVLL